MATRHNGLRATHWFALGLGLALTLGAPWAWSQVNLNIGNLEQDKGIRIEYDTAISPSPSGSQISNQGTISGDNFSDELTDDPDIGGSADPTITPLASLPQADLSVSKSDDVDPVLAGSNLTYTITVTNAGPNPAENVAVSDTLPSDVTFVSATPDQGSCSEAGGGVTCDLESVPDGVSVNIAIVVTTTTAGTLTNTASVTSDPTDPATDNNSATELTTVNPVMMAQCPNDVLISNYQTTAPQFVEVANVGSGMIDLAGCSLVTFDAVTELSIMTASKDLSGTLDPGDTQQVEISGAPTSGPGAVGIFNAPAPDDGTPFSADNEITGMVYLANDSVFGIAHLTVPEHNDIYDCIYGETLPPGNFPRVPLDECFPGP